MSYPNYPPQAAPPQQGYPPQPGYGQQPGYPPADPAYPPQQQYAPPAPPQQGYPAPQGYPAQQSYPAPQGYAQPPAQQGPPPPKTGLADYASQPAMSGTSLQFPNPGTRYSFTVARELGDADFPPQYLPDNKTVRTFNDGRPMTNMVVPVLLDMPDAAHPDRQAAWWVRGQAGEALKQAMSRVGAGHLNGIPEEGARITVAFTNTKQPRNAAYNPAKIYEVTYARPAGAANGQVQQPVYIPPAQEQAPPQQQYQAPVQQGYPPQQQPPAQQGYPPQQQPPAQQYAPPQPPAQPYAPPAPAQQGFPPDQQYAQQYDPAQAPAPVQQAPAYDGTLLAVQQPQPGYQQAQVQQNLPPAPQAPAPGQQAPAGQQPAWTPPPGMDAEHVALLNEVMLRNGGTQPVPQQ